MSLVASSTQSMLIGASGAYDTNENDQLNTIPNILIEIEKKLQVIIKIDSQTFNLINLSINYNYHC